MNTTVRIPELAHRIRKHTRDSKKLYLYCKIKTSSGSSLQRKNEELGEVTQAEEIADREARQTNSEETRSDTDQLNDYLTMATIKQNQIYETIISYPFGFHLIHGGADVGLKQLDFASSHWCCCCSRRWSDNSSFLRSHQ
ncbi:hypothetical protein BD770DRAFT_416407 [Pilaira anomala]|nr:hypothetical protein BD770DRAFT_416407 [Pilaira anomala]